MKRAMKTFFSIFKEVFAIAPGYVVIATFTQVFDQLLSVVNIYVIQFVLNSIATSNSIYTIILILFVSGVAYVFIEILKNHIKNITTPQYQQKIQFELQRKVYAKAAAVDVVLYDTPGFYDQFALALQIDTYAITSVQNFSALFGIICGIAALTSLISSLQPILVLVALGMAIVSTVFSSFSMKYQLQFVEKSISLDRRIDYVSRCFYLPNFVKEIRIFPIAQFLENRHKEAFEQKSSLIVSKGKKQCAVGNLRSFFITFITYSTMGMLAANTISGKYLIGNFVALLNSVKYLNNNIEGVFQVLRQTYENTLYLEKYLDFMEFPDHKTKKTANLIDAGISIVISDVSFKYPTASQYALKNICMHISCGEIVAFAGTNGSGKSTLIKLITGLYTPECGSIRINNHAIDYYSYNDSHDIIGCVFQECQLLETTILENVLFRPSCNREVDEEIAWKALEQVGMKERVKKLSNGLYTQISKEFDPNGAVFSGGETQRIALSRIFTKPYKLIILDEPSNSLDKKTEGLFFKNIVSLPHRPTIIFIAHGRQELMYAEKIFFFESGELTSVGTFDELALQNRTFIKMYQQ